MTVRIVHKSSSASGKNPTGSQLANAEIAINYHADGPFISAKDTNGRVVRLGGVWMQENSPADPTHMTFWVRLSTNQLFLYDANTSAWRGVTGTGGGGGGGGGDITDVLGGDGITVTNSAGPQPTVSVDLENNRGLEIDSGNLRGVIASAANLGVVKQGAGVTIGADGTLSAAATPLKYVGVVDLSDATTRPSSAAVGDVFANTGTTSVAADWAPRLSNAASGDNIDPGDLIACTVAATSQTTGTYTLIPTGGASPATNLTYTARDGSNAANAGTVNSDTGTDANIPAAGNGGNAGLMIPGDKTKLDGIAAGAQTGTVTSITPGTGLENSGTNDKTAITGAGTLDLQDTAVTAGTYGDASNVAQITVDAQGRITDATEVALGAAAPPANGNYGFWTRTDATDTLTPRTANDNLNQGSGTITTTGAVTGGSLTASTGDATVTAGNLTVTAGNATVSGTVVSGDPRSLTGQGTGSQISPTGRVTASRASSSTDYVWTGFATGDTDATSTIASDGSAVFKGSVLSHDFFSLQGTTHQVRFHTDTDDLTIRTGNAGGGNTERLRVHGGDNQTEIDVFNPADKDNPSIKFIGNGNAEFRGHVDNAGEQRPGNNVKVFGNFGQLLIKKIGGTNAIEVIDGDNIADKNFQVSSAGRVLIGPGDAPTIQLNEDGSAKFLGASASLKVGKANSANYYVDVDGTLQIGTLLDGASETVKTELNKDGSAFFAGQKATITKEGKGVFSDQIESLRLTDATNLHSKGVWAGGHRASLGGGSNYTSFIFADGSAQFIRLYRPTFTNTNSGTGWSLDTRSINVQQPNTGDSTVDAFAVFYGASRVWGVDYTGSAHFRGSVIFQLEPDNPDNYTITTEEYEEQEELTPYVPPVPATYNEEGEEVTPEVPAVEATYETVTKTREIKKYSGPTLDVKEVLMDLQQRVADRDAVIADLTTRIAALESAQ